jgi:hypothetical protein
MLWTVMAEIIVVEATKKDALCQDQAGVDYLPRRRPPRRAVGRDQLILSRAPDGIDDRKQRARNSAACGHGASTLENLGRVGLVGKPPLKQPPRQVDRIARQREPGRAKAVLIAERAGRPLRRAPRRGDDDAEHNGDLANVDLCRKHSLPQFTARRERRDEKGENDAHSIEIKIALGNEIRVDQMRRREVKRDPASEHFGKHLNRM